MLRRASAVLLAVALTACTSEIQGSPDDAVVRPSITPSPAELPQPGQCTDTGVDVKDCAQAHAAEVTEIGTFDLPTATPTESDFRLASLPACRAAATAYLGSTDHDATRLQAQAFWPSRDGWARGDRWRLCTVVEIRPDGMREQRTGTVKDLLKTAGFPTVQLCAEGSPAKDEGLKTTTCDRPHQAEAVPGVLTVGKPGDKRPADVDAQAAPHCAKAVKGYLNAERPDVTSSWRTFGAQGWAEGFTTVVCYAETTRPFTGTLWGIGTKPLP